MTPQPLVYVILVNWNGKGVTLDCLESLQKVGYPNYRTLVVDNDSSDGSVKAIKELFPDVMVLEMKQNLRFAAGTNAGITYALGHGAELVLPLNNDTTVDPGFLSAMVDRIITTPTIGAVAPKIFYHSDPSRIWFAGGVISLWTGTMRHIGIREVDRGQYDTSKTIEYTTGCCFLTKREVVEKVGLLDEAYSMYTEDADWSMRVRRSGYVILFEPKARIWHKLSVSAGGHLSWYKMSNKFVSNLRFFARYATWYQWFIFPWASILVNAAAAARYILTTRHK